MLAHTSRQGRYPDLHYVQAAIQFFAESPFFHGCRHVRISVRAATRAPTFSVSLLPIRSMDWSCSTRNSFACAPGVNEANAIEDQR